MLQRRKPSAPRSEQATWVRVPGQPPAGMGTGQPLTSGDRSPVPRFSVPAKHRTWAPREFLLSRPRALGAAARNQHSIPQHPASKRWRPGWLGRVWYRWKKSCAADAAPCHPIACG